jgi:hypothetical protein
MRDLELHLRAHVPGNIYANNMFRDLEAKIPAGDTAGLIKAWIKATEMQSEISNVNIKRATEMVQVLPSNPTSRAAPSTLFSTSVPVFAPAQTTRGPSPWASSPQASWPFTPSPPPTVASRTIPSYLQRHNHNGDNNGNNN